MVNLKTLEQICLQLASYLENNEIANVEDLKSVHETLTQVFPNSLTKPFIPAKVNEDNESGEDYGNMMELDMFDN